jgi:hypothetical protein
MSIVKTGEPVGGPERTTFEPFESFEDPLESATELVDWDSFAKVPDFPPNEGPIPGRIQSIDGTKIQGTKDPLVDVLADEIGLDVLAALDSIEGLGTTAIADLIATNYNWDHAYWHSHKYGYWNGQRGYWRVTGGKHVFVVVP